MIRLFGIRFRFHPLFTVLMLVSVLTGYFVELLALFAVVLIHELGHVAAARGFGWTITKVELMPFGGVAETEESGKAPVREELLVALAGPLQNAWMAGFAAVMQLTGAWSDDWSGFFLRANLIIGLFNLLPILPLDGGKIMQSLISCWLPYYRAIQTSTWISFGLSLLLLLASIWQFRSDGVALNLLVIALFLLYSNWYGYRNASYQFVRFLMSRDVRMDRLIAKGTLAQPIVIYPHRTVSDIVRLFMREKYHLVYILNERGGIQAVLPESKLLFAYFHLKERGSAVSDIFMIE